jgi:hypothetical protein
MINHTLRTLGVISACFLLGVCIFGCSGGKNPIVIPVDSQPSDPATTVMPGDDTFSPFGGGGKNVAVSLAQFGLQCVLGWGVGTGLDAVFGLIFSGDGDFNEINQQLGEMDQKLDEIKDELDTIKNNQQVILDQLDCLGYDLKNYIMFNNLKDSQRQIELHVRYEQNNFLDLEYLLNTGQIKGLDERLALFAQDRTQSNDLIYHIKTINDGLLDAPGIMNGKGLLTLWSEYLVKCKPNMGLVEANELLTNSFCELLAAELEGFDLLSESMDTIIDANQHGFNYTGDTNKPALIQDFRIWIEAQLRQYLRAVEYLVIGKSDYPANHPFQSGDKFLHSDSYAVLSEADFFASEIWRSIVCGRDEEYPADCQLCREYDPNYGVVLRVIGDEQWVESWTGARLEPDENGGWMSNQTPVDHPVFTTQGDKGENRYPFNWWSDGYISWDPTLTKAKRATHIKVKRLYYPVASSEHVFPVFNVDNPLDKPPDSVDDRVYWGDLGPIEFEFMGNYDSSWDRTKGTSRPPYIADEGFWCARFRSQVLPAFIEPNEALNCKYRWIPYSFSSQYETYGLNINQLNVNWGEPHIKWDRYYNWSKAEWITDDSYFRPFKWIGNDGDIGTAFIIEWWGEGASIDLFADFWGFFWLNASFYIGHTLSCSSSNQNQNIFQDSYSQSSHLAHNFFNIQNQKYENQSNLNLSSNTNYRISYRVECKFLTPWDCRFSFTPTMYCRLNRVSFFTWQ